MPAADVVIPLGNGEVMLGLTIPSGRGGYAFRIHDYTFGMGRLRMGVSHT